MNKVLAYLSRGHHTNTIQLLPIVFFFFCHWYQIFRLLHFIQDFNNWEATGECAMLLVACFRMGGYTPVGHGKRYVHIAS